VSAKPVSRSFALSSYGHFAHCPAQHGLQRIFTRLIDSGSVFLHFAPLTRDSSQRSSGRKWRCLEFTPSQPRDAFTKELDNPMNRTFNILTRTELAATAVCASLLSVVTMGAVLGLFATASPSVTVDRFVLETVVISAPKSV
jgi:hypothetical protein